MRELQSNITSATERTWSRYMTSKLMGIWVLKTVLKEEDFLLGTIPEDIVVVSSSRATLPPAWPLYLSWYGLLKNLIMFFQQCSLQSMLVHWKDQILSQASSEISIPDSPSRLSLIIECYSCWHWKELCTALKWIEKWSWSWHFSECGKILIQHFTLWRAFTKQLSGNPPHLFIYSLLCPLKTVFSQLSFIEQLRGLCHFNVNLSFQSTRISIHHSQ